MQTALFRIWTWVTMFIPYDDNHYNKSASRVRVDLGNNGNQGTLHTCYNSRTVTLPLDAVNCHNLGTLFWVGLRRCSLCILSPTISVIGYEGVFYTFIMLGNSKNMATFSHGRFFGFNGISTFVGYLMSNQFLNK